MTDFKASILVIDDTTNERDIICKRLEKDGYQVYATGSGMEGIELVEKRKIDLVLLDILMPDVDGYEVLMDLREKYSAIELPVIMVTALDNSGDKVKALSLGANDFVTKPHDYYVIRARIETQISYKRTQEILLESEERFRGAFGSAVIGMALLGTSGSFVQVNPSLCKMMGYTQEELVTKTLQQLLHKDDVKKTVDMFHKLLSGEENAIELEIRCIDRSGKDVWVYMSVSALVKSRGNPLYFISQYQDITERKMNEVALKESEEKYRQLFSAESDPIFLVDAQTHKITDVNTPAMILYGYTRDEFIGLSVEDISAEPGETGFSIVDVTIKDKKKIPLRYHRKKDGTEFPVEISTGSFTLKGRKYACAIVRDITARMELDAMKNEFISMVSHELNTPLSVISGSLSLISEGLLGDVNEKQMKQMEIAGRNVERLIRLVSDLLDISRLESGRFNIQKEEIDLRAPVMIACQALYQMAHDRGIKLVFPSSESPKVFVQADMARLEQVVINLVRNGMRFAETKVTVGLSETDDATIIKVEDDGPGLAASDIPQIFDKFYRGSIPKKAGGGTGLGLAIVNGIVEAHGGKVSVTNLIDPNDNSNITGAMFTVTLPKT